MKKREKIEQKIEVEKIENGFVVTFWLWEEEDTYVQHKNVFEVYDKKDYIPFLTYLYEQHFGEFPGYDKFKSDNINISFDRKGHKVE